MEYLVAYDVDTTTPAGAQRLRRVAKVCEGSGIRVQKSVFEVVCTRSHFPMLRQRLLDQIDRQLDSIRIYQLHEGTLAAVDLLGRAELVPHFGDHIL